MHEYLDLESAFDYCEAHQVNMLSCEHCYLEEHALFTLYSIREEVLFRIIAQTRMDEKRTIILPYELCRRASKSIKFDTSRVHTEWT
jgi:hypothetical protein